MGTTNKPPVSTQAARETAKAIRRAKKLSDKTSAQQSGAVLNDLLLSEAQGQAEGKDALSNLKRLRASKLPEGDAVIMAQRLYGEVQRLKQHLKTRSMLLRDFCSLIGIDASGSSKELHRLTLAPNQDPASVRLRRSADKYYSLIRGISEYGNRNLNTLADDVLRGTSLHPSANFGEMNEAEKLALALQITIDNIDREFGLHEKFQQTATLKSQFINSGIAQFWPLWGWEYEDEDGKIRSAYLRYASDPKNSYWDKLENPEYGEVVYSENGFPNPQFNGLLQSCEFFHIPHAPIGVVEYANIPRKPQHAEFLPEYEEKVESWIKNNYWELVDAPKSKTHLEEYNSVSDEWDDDSKKPYGQMSHDNGIARGTNYAWLIIYPTRDNSRLMPMMYIPYEEGGPYILPLNSRNLEIMRDAFWINTDEYKSLFDRIKDLLGYLPEQENFFDKRLRETVPWFDYNPILKIAHDKKADSDALDNFCLRLWNKS